MPYISQEERDEIDIKIFELSQCLETKGQMNYAISFLLHQYIKKNGLKYNNINDAIGIIECAKMELYRSIAGPYEDIKIEENGDLGIV